MWHCSIYSYRQQECIVYCIVITRVFVLLLLLSAFIVANLCAIIAFPISSFYCAIFSGAIKNSIQYHWISCLCVCARVHSFVWPLSSFPQSKDGQFNRTVPIGVNILNWELIVNVRCGYVAAQHHWHHQHQPYQQRRRLNLFIFFHREQVAIEMKYEEQFVSDHHFDRHVIIV